MYSKEEFAAFELMCRGRAEVAKKEMEYWLAEAEEWKQLSESPDPFIEGRANPAGCTESTINKVIPMTPYLIAAREGMIWWVTLTMIPVEIVFDAIEDELNRRGRSP